MKYNEIIKKITNSLQSGKRGKVRYEDAVENDYLKNRIELLEELLKERTTCVENAKSIFLRNLYHEIRTPLNAIVGFSELIELNSLGKEEKDQYIKHIKDSSKQFLRMMDNIIEASIIEAGLMKISVSQCSLDSLLEEIHAYFAIQKHISNKDITLLISKPENTIDFNVYCDSYRLSQVLINLISNAFKFTEKGSIEFGYSINSDEIQFFVSDTGKGGLEGKEKIFNSFTKLDESDSSQEGLGLGLSLSKKLIELMSGNIWYESGDSEGTTFKFTIPYKPVLIKNIVKNKRKHNFIKNTIKQKVFNSAAL